MHFFLPPTNGLGDLAFGGRGIFPLSSRLARIAALHDDLDGAMNTDEKHIEIDKTLPRIPFGFSIGIVIGDIGDDIHAALAEGGYRAMERVIELGNLARYASRRFLVARYRRT